MARFALRHWTAILIVVAVAAWAIFYLPYTPSFTVFELKRAVDVRDGQRAAQYVDFEQVVRNAGYEMLDDPNGPGSSVSAGSPNPFAEMLGRGAVDILSGPTASILKSWAVQQVDNGAKDVQMPPAAVAGAIVLLHRNGDTAYTRFTDRKGQTWGVRMRKEDGGWKIVKVDNVRQILAKLQHEAQKNYGIAP
jgi:hypothetical protein